MRSFPERHWYLWWWTLPPNPEMPCIALHGGGAIMIMQQLHHATCCVNQLQSTYIRVNAGNVAAPVASAAWRSVRPPSDAGGALPRNNDNDNNNGISFVGCTVVCVCATFAAVQMRTAWRQWRGGPSLGEGPPQGPPWLTLSCTAPLSCWGGAINHLPGTALLLFGGGDKGQHAKHGAWQPVKGGC